MLTCVCQPADARLLWSRQRPNMAPRPRNLTLRPQQPITTPPQKKKHLKDYEKWSINNDLIINDENFPLKNGLNVFNVDKMAINDNKIGLGNKNYTLKDGLNVYKDDNLPIKIGENGFKEHNPLRSSLKESNLPRNGLNVYKEDKFPILEDVKSGSEEKGQPKNDLNEKVLKEDKFAILENGKCGLEEEDLLKNGLCVYKVEKHLLEDRKSSSNENQLLKNGLEVHKEDNLSFGSGSRRNYQHQNGSYGNKKDKLPLESGENCLKENCRPKNGLKISKVYKEDKTILFECGKSGLEEKDHQKNGLRVYKVEKLPFDNGENDLKEKQHPKNGFSIYTEDLESGENGLEEEYTYPNGLRVPKIFENGESNPKVNYRPKSDLKIHMENQTSILEGGLQEGGLKETIHPKNGLKVYKEDQTFSSKSIRKEEILITVKNSLVVKNSVKEGLTVKNGIYVKEIPNTKTEEFSRCKEDSGMDNKDDVTKLALEGVGGTNCTLTLTELRDMAMRQQRQIDGQQQLLAAREQRLRYLKEQEARQQRAAAETERLRRLRDRVDQQELKLRKLRALRGQVECGRQNNVSLTSDLESIRALFNEKEKELSLAVAKVDELTRQLEELRRGRPNQDQTPSAAALELDKLRRELMYRNKLNEQQNARLCQQRKALTARQEEMKNIDKRISELQDRLHRKRILNQQLANQITATSHKANNNQSSNIRVNQQNGGTPHNGIPNKTPMRGNIAAVEPYKHVPNQNQLVNDLIEPNKADNHQEFLPEFAASKSDPKYQTLPYNTKFTVNFVKKDIENNNNIPLENENKALSQQHSVVHSIPLNLVNKSLAQPLITQSEHKPELQNRLSNGEIKNKFGNSQIRGQPVGQSAIATQPVPNLSTLPNLVGPQKPVSSVAPTSINKQVPTSIYQTSSTKIQPVQPQTLLTNNQNLTLSPPQSTSTPIGTPEVNKEEKQSPKPALPPKPSIKPPPRQTTPQINDDNSPNQQTTNDEIINITSNFQHITTNNIQPPTPPIEFKHESSVPAIKAKPLTIKKQALGEQPRLKSLSTRNGYHISINRRIEMPPAFLFPELDNLPTDLSSADSQDDANSQEKDLNVLNTDSNQNIGDGLNKLLNEVTSISTDGTDNVVMRVKKGNLKQNGKANLSRRVSFDPLALLLDASLEVGVGRCWRHKLHADADRAA